MSVQLNLVSAEELLPLVWPSEKSRPSLRWLREQQAARKIPFIRIGRLVWFDPDQVIAALQNQKTMKAREQ